MRKKVFFIAAIWIIIAISVFVLYCLREVSPMKELITWAASVRPILASIGGLGLLVSGGIIRHEFGEKGKKGDKTGNKKPHIFSSLLMTGDKRTHKCSQCGYGVVVNEYDTGVVCPKCGNADDIIPRL